MKPSRNSIDVSAFGVTPSASGDAAPGVRKALARAISEGASRLVFPKGTYHFHPDRAAEEHLYISNNDEGLHSIAMLIRGAAGLTIDGQGSRFVFHKDIVPIAVRASDDITIAGIEIDWAQTFTGEALIVGAGDGYADIEIPQRLNYRVEYGHLLFLDEAGAPFKTGYSLEFDATARQPASGVCDNFHMRTYVHAQEIGPRQVRLTAKYDAVPGIGNILILQNEKRTSPAITIGDSRNVEVSNVTVRHANGMALIAQRTHDIRVHNFTVSPSGGRMISSGGDATHFVNCKGLIEIDGCLAENMMDDFTNVHGIYASIVQATGDRQVDLRLMHRQQLGIDITQFGDAVEFVRRDTMARYHVALVTAAERINKSFTRLTLSEALPKDIQAGDGLQSLGWQPDLTIRNCVLRKYRGRGCLITTAGKALVENNLFQTAGAAISIEGDVRNWYESGAVRDVLIRKNRFENCNYLGWGQPTIQVNPRIDPEHRAGTLYHKEIRVEDNRFETFHNSLVRAHCVDGFTFSGNEVHATSAYPPRADQAKVFEIEHSANVKIEGNRFDDAFRARWGRSCP
ncbi:MAG: right-handed parallel beta-helix repeat-containing protein [Capsulimonadaceae bacterium]|nr:right-handed parallel beta-helix repeat-containing protein [Capsulimonadaceae bacterium]